jgi:uncharacterized protein YidB (DUF937 family)
MGLLDQVLGGVLNQATGGAQPQAQDPLSAILGGVLGGGGGGSSPLLAIAMTLVQQSGGLPGLLAKFQQAGLGAQVASWVGTGPNAPVTGPQVQQALGAETVGGVASQLGMSNEAASSGLAQVLPALVNHLTPSGDVPANHGDLLSQALSALTR